MCHLRMGLTTRQISLASLHWKRESVYHEPAEDKASPWQVRQDGSQPMNEDGSQPMTSALHYWLSKEPPRHPISHGLHGLHGVFPVEHTGAGILSID